MKDRDWKRMWKLIDQYDPAKDAWKSIRRMRDANTVSLRACIDELRGHRVRMQTDVEMVEALLEYYNTQEKAEADRLQSSVGLSYDKIVQILEERIEDSRKAAEILDKAVKMGEIEYAKFKDQLLERKIQAWDEEPKPEAFVPQPRGGMCESCGRRPRHFDNLCKRCAKEQGIHPKGKIQ